MPDIITPRALERRRRWLEDIRSFDGVFVNSAEHFERRIQEEFHEEGPSALLDHLRLCGAIPESYDHDSSQEKLYSKYTDVLLSVAYKKLGCRSIVLDERGDSADVEAVTDEFDFVADAKAFRLSRTARNAKDFKVTSMHTWKRGKQYAMLVAPLYQMPSRKSQIYTQAINHDVCLLSFSHLALLCNLAFRSSIASAQNLLESIFKVVNTLHVQHDANAYWQAINKSFLDADALMPDLWREEKLAAAESLRQAKEEALTFLSEERSRILSLDREAAIQALIRCRKLDEKQRQIERITGSSLMG